MRILFVGCPSIAIPSLEFLISKSNESGNFTLAGLLTNPDSPKGRSSKHEPTECAAALKKLNSDIKVFKFDKLDANAREQIAALKPDILVSFAYGKFFGPKFLALFPKGAINIHPSLLPKYRGPTPIPAAIINKEAQTGITFQLLADEMDCGDILLQEIIPLDGRETTASLSETISKKAAKMMPLVLDGIIEGTIIPQPQNHKDATYCSLISKEDGIINWSHSACEIDARIRAFNPWPLTWTFHGDLQLFILKAQSLNNGESTFSPGMVLGKDKEKGILIQTGSGILAVTELQYKTKKALNWKDFLNGVPKIIGEKLG